MALKTGFPDTEKPAVKTVRKPGLNASHKPVNRFTDHPRNLRTPRTPGRQSSNIPVARTYAEQGLENTPLTTGPRRAVTKASRPGSKKPFRKAALFAKAMLLHIQRIPRSFRTKGKAPVRYAARGKAKNARNKRIVYISAVLIPLAALVIVLAATLGRDTSKTTAGASTGPSAMGSALIADVNGVIPGVPVPSVSSAASATLVPTNAPTGTAETSAAPTPTATPVPTVTPEPTPVPTTKPEPTPKPIDLNELVKYYKVDADKYYNQYGYSSNHYEYTEDDVYMLAQVITRESGHETADGKIAVGNVIMNRVFCGYWGSTILSVVSAPGQFSYKPEQVPNSQSINAARDVLKNEHWVIPQDIYFFNSGKTPGENWGSHTYYTQIGGHCFYRESIGRRHRGGEAPPKLFDREYKWPQYGCKPAKRVTRIQHMLRALGYDVGQDGYFGMSTKEALSDFQKKKGIKADGVAGPSTIKALIKAYGKDKYYKDYVK